ncbi:MAG: TlpA disulfide reductase family protein [Aggregatilineales bacterium]
MTDALPLQPETTRRSGFGLGAILLLGAVLVVAAIIGLALARAQQGQPLSGPAPDFAFTTFEGESYRLSDFRGSVVVINFWASWCASCRSEAPHLEAAWQHYAPRGDVVFIGIAYADNGPRSLAYIDEFSISFLNAPDIGTRISRQYGITGVPETFIIDREGNVARFIYAGVTEAQIRSIVDGLL